MGYPRLDSLDVTAHVNRLPTGEFAGYIEYKRFAGTEIGYPPVIETFPAGVFANRSEAQAAAVVLMSTFLKTILPPDLLVA